MVPGPGTGNEQHAAFSLQVLGMGDGVLAVRSDRGWFGNQALLDADEVTALLVRMARSARPDS